MDIDDWFDTTVIGSDYQEQYNPSTKQYRHKMKSLTRLFYSPRSFEQQLEDNREDMDPKLWTVGPAPKPSWSKP